MSVVTTRHEFDGRCTRPNGGGISLILATIGRTHELEHFLRSIVIPEGVLSEIILVDQNKDNILADIVDMARSRGLSIRHIRIYPLKGLSLARNIGIQKSNYPIIAFPDDDCLYECDTITRVLNRFSESPDIDGIVARWHERHLTSMPSGLIDRDKQRSFRGVPIASICLFIKASVFKRIGAFDERLGIGTWAGSSEETDLILRALEKSLNFMYCADVVVHHKWCPSVSDNSLSLCAIYTQAKQRARGTGVIYKKHNLGAVVIIRGLVAPLLKALVNFLRPRFFLYWLGTTVGRMQGIIVYQLK